MRPMTICKDFYGEINIIDLIGASIWLFEVISSLLTFDHIFKHGFDFTYCIVAALYLQQFDHAILSIRWNTGFV